MGQPVGGCPCGEVLEDVAEALEEDGTLGGAGDLLVVRVGGVALVVFLLLERFLGVDGHRHGGREEDDRAPWRRCELFTARET